MKEELKMTSTWWKEWNRDTVDNVEFELLQHHLASFSDQLTSEQENQPHNLAILCQDDWKWYKMVPISMAGI